MRTMLPQPHRSGPLERIVRLQHASTEPARTIALQNKPCNEDGQRWPALQQPPPANAERPVGKARAPMCERERVYEPARASCEHRTCAAKRPAQANQAVNEERSADAKPTRDADDKPAQDQETIAA